MSGEAQQHIGQGIPEPHPMSNGSSNEPMSNFKEIPTVSQDFSLDAIDDLLSLIPEDVTPVGTEVQGDKGVLDDIDALVGDVDKAVQEARNEVKSWDLERKRKEAASSVDAFTLDLLASDENPLIRTLVCANPHARPEFLTRVVKEGNPYLQYVAANNASADPEMLDRLAQSNTPEVKQAVAQNPSTSPVTLHRMRN